MALLLALMGCAPPAAPGAPPSPAPVTVAVAWPVESGWTLRGAMTVTGGGPRGRASLLTVRAGRRGGWEVRLDRGAWRRVTGTLSVRGGGLRPSGGSAVQAGQLVLDAGRLSWVTALPLEDYVARVVAAELGRAGLDTPAALEAQAILARTYVLANRGKYAGRAFDIRGTTADQVVARAAPPPAMRAAAAATAGLVLRDAAGRLADVFYHSTCGGVTEDARAVFAGADRAYLRGVSDRDPAGQAYCAASPHSAWTQSVGPATLRRVARGLARLEIMDRTASGRVAVLVGQDVQGRTLATWRGPAIRAAFPGATPLRSLALSVDASPDGGVLVRGVGWGHGVGMCQYGAIGRARSGATAAAILAAYFPGTVVAPWATDDS